MSFSAVLESERAPRTVAAFLARLPFEGQLVQARWSGEAGWMPLGDFDLGGAYENATSYPAPGQVLWHPPGLAKQSFWCRTAVPASPAASDSLRATTF